MQQQYMMQYEPGRFGGDGEIVVVIGLSALLAASTSVVMAAGLGFALLLALSTTSLILAAIRTPMGPELHAPVVVAVFVSCLGAVELLAAVAWPSLNAALAAALPLLVAVGLLLPDTRVFAREQSSSEWLRRAALAGMTSLALGIVLGGLREAFGQGSLLGNFQLLVEPVARVTGDFAGLRVVAADRGIQFALLLPGGLLLLGLLAALRNVIVSWRRDS